MSYQRHVYINKSYRPSKYQTLLLNRSFKMTRPNNPTKLFSSLSFILIPQIILSLFFFTNTAMSQNTTVPVNVGLVLDINGEVEKVALSCINMSLTEFYNSNSHYKTRLILNTRDSKRDVVAAAAAGTYPIIIHHLSLFLNL